MLSSCLRWCFSLSLILGTACLVHSEPPGTAKPGPGDEQQARKLLPAGALALFGSLEPYANNRDLVAAFSADGKWVATGGKDDTVSLWNAATGKAVRRLQGLSEVYCFAFSPDGKYLATGNDDKAVHLWDLGTGKERREFVGHQADVIGLVFSPNGKTLAAAERGAAVRIWDTGTGKETLHILAQGGVLGLLFLPSGKTLVCAYGDGTIRFHEASTGKQLRQLDTQQRGTALALAVSPDGTTLASAHNNTRIYLSDVATGRELHQLIRQDPQFATRCLAFSPDGKTLASGGSDGKIRLWEVATGKECRQFKMVFQSQAANIGSVAFAPDGRTLVAGNMLNTAALVWDVFAPRTEGKPGKLRPEDLEELWTDLACEVAPTAWQAVCRLTAAPGQSVPFLQERLRPAAASDGQRIARLIADLDSGRFAVREGATRELEKLRAEPALRRALASNPSAEVRLRIELLLEGYQKGGLSPDHLREARAVRVLEHLASPQARRVLQALAKGTPDARLTQDAKAALGRLAHRAATAR
ncbi:MAG TPA: WD40 repeat domain-containing protein [Gemmataceae bacterium]|jgi:Tol biopolymer transport system component|nr:WD40 repeat domain-containing protein [Gemmataceae bacterium]